MKKHFLDVVGAGSVAGEFIFISDATVSQFLYCSHRYTTGFVQILQDFPHSPHLLLDKYIQHSTRGDPDRPFSEDQAFRPTDGMKYSESEPELSGAVKSTVCTGRINWGLLEQSSNLQLRQMVHTNLLKLSTRTSQNILFDDVHRAVSLGIAMVAPSKAPVQQVISGESKLELLLPEPLAIARALMVFKDRQNLGIESYVATELSNPEPSARGTAFELAASVMLALNLDGTKSLRSAFHFASEGTLGSFLNSNVQLVSLLGWEDQTPIVCPAGLYYGASPHLAYAASNPEDTKTWCKGSFGIPILLPDADMGPDIIALLQVGDQFIWLICQVKAHGQRTLKTSLEGTTKSMDGESSHTAKVSLIECSSNCRVNYCSRKIKLLAPRCILDYPTRFKSSFVFRPSLLSVLWSLILQWSGWRKLKRLWRQC